MAQTKRMTRVEQKAQTRERLLASAKKVFAKRGYAQASTEAIAEEAGFTVGAVYSNFASKEDLFMELFEQHTGERLATMREMVETAEALPEARIREAVRSLLSHMTEDRDLWLLYLEFWRSAVSDQKLRKRFIAYNQQVLASITDLLNSQFESLGIEPQVSADKVAAAATMLTDGFMLYRLIGHPNFSDELFEAALNKMTGALVLTPEGEPVS